MEPHTHHEHDTEHAHKDTHHSKKPLLTLPAAVLTGLTLIAIAIMFTMPGVKKESPSEAPQGTQPGIPTSVPAEIVRLRANDHVSGDAGKAKVLIFEYSDSDCPFCAKFHPTLQSVVTDYKGKVAWVYRHFPLDMHPNAYTEAIALECAAKLGGNDVFWNYLDTIVNVTLDPEPGSNAALVQYATQEGINADQFKACFADPSIATKVDADTADAGTIGARGTPFSIAVNVQTGEQVVIPGAYPLEDVKKMIDGIL